MTLDGELIQSTIKSLEAEVEAIEDQIDDLVIYLEGGITISEASMLSSKQRDRIIKKLNKKLSAMSGKEWM